jgi:ATP-binding cassette subfamily F protein uup
VKALSGGERNRLLLARLLTRPANVLVLDEPTNDLDLETLELLDEQLLAWPGTLLLVSHDRRFLDNVVTSTLVFEGGGTVREYVGGYADWLRASGSGLQAPADARSPKPESRSPKPEARKRRSFREEREYAALPDTIAALEDGQRRLHAEVASPDFYKAPADVIKVTLARLEAIDTDLMAAYARWDELDSIVR